MTQLEVLAIENKGNYWKLLPNNIPGISLFTNHPSSTTLYRYKPKIHAVHSPQVQEIFPFSCSESYKDPLLHGMGYGHSRMADLFQPIRITETNLKSSPFSEAVPSFSPSHSWQPTHQNYHYVLVSSHCRLEKGNIDSCQGLNVFVLIPPPSLLCQRQTSTNTEHLNDSSSSHQKDSILQEVEVTD